MDADKKMKILMAVATRLVYHDIQSPNSARLQVKLARFMSHPAFRGQGVTLREVLAVYAEVCSRAMAIQAEFRRR